MPPDFRRAGEGQDVVEPPGRIRIPPGQHRARPAASRNRDSGRGEVARDGNVDSVPVSSHRCVVGDQPAAGPPACSPPVMTAGSADVKRIAVHQFGPLARSARPRKLVHRPGARPASSVSAARRTRPRTEPARRHPATEVHVSSRAAGSAPDLTTTDRYMTRRDPRAGHVLTAHHRACPPARPVPTRPPRSAVALVMVAGPGTACRPAMLDQSRSESTSSRP